MHDSLAAIPLSLMTAQRVTNCYDLMDAPYCSSVLREHSRSLGHVPLIDHRGISCHTRIEAIGRLLLGLGVELPR